MLMRKIYKIFWAEWKFHLCIYHNQTTVRHIGPLKVHTLLKGIIHVISRELTQILHGEKTHFKSFTSTKTMDSICQKLHFFPYAGMCLIKFSVTIWPHWSRDIIGTVL